MRFALFYEIPVARPWDPDSEHRAYQNVLEQAVAGENGSAGTRSGPSSTTSWTSTRTARTPRSSTGRSRHAPSASGSATA